jgi:hypothetical protein
MFGGVLVVIEGAFDEDGDPVGEASPVGFSRLPGSLPDVLLKLEVYVAGCHDDHAMSR